MIQSRIPFLLSKVITKEDELLVKAYQRTVEEDRIDTALIVKLLVVVNAKEPPGSVLVFLPGYDDISRLMSQLTKHELFGDTRRFIVLPLHSAISSAEQQRVFVQAPPVSFYNCFYLAF